MCDKKAFQFGRMPTDHAVTMMSSEQLAINYCNSMPSRCGVGRTICCKVRLSVNAASFVNGFMARGESNRNYSGFVSAAPVLA